LMRVICGCVEDMAKSRANFRVRHSRVKRIENLIKISSQLTFLVIQNRQRLYIRIVVWGRIKRNLLHSSLIRHTLSDLKNLFTKPLQIFFFSATLWTVIYFRSFFGYL